VLDGIDADDGVGVDGFEGRVALRDVRGDELPSEYFLANETRGSTMSIPMTWNPRRAKKEDTIPGPHPISQMRISLVFCFAWLFKRL
jgi:hypothetical protein